jgi:hypothetical protein
MLLGQGGCVSLPLSLPPSLPPSLSLFLSLPPHPTPIPRGIPLSPPRRPRRGARCGRSASRMRRTVDESERRRSLGWRIRASVGRAAGAGTARGYRSAAAATASGCGSRRRPRRDRIQESRTLCSPLCASAIHGRLPRIQKSRRPDAGHGAGRRGRVRTPVFASLRFCNAWPPPTRRPLTHSGAMAASQPTPSESEHPAPSISE